MEEVIRIEGLSFGYPDGKPALKDINLSIKRGEIVALIGPNGAGKSTLMLHLNGILRSNIGTIKVLGKEVNDSNLKWIRSKLGLVFQNPDDQLFMPTVFDDVAFGPINMSYPENQVRQSVTRALSSVGMNGYEKRSPHHMSIGEKKRISIATVMSMNPEILVIDEPTSNLDPSSKWSLIDLLKSLPMTELIATHDLELVQALCPRTVILDKGETVADDSTTCILSDKALLKAHGLAPLNGHLKQF